MRKTLIISAILLCIAALSHAAGPSRLTDTLSTATADTLAATRSDGISPVRPDTLAATNPAEFRIQQDNLTPAPADAAAKRHSKAKQGRLSPEQSDSLTIVAADTVITSDTISVEGYGDVVIENVRTDGFMQEPAVKYTDEFLDTIEIKKKFLINDYTLVGVQYGVTMNRMSFNPSMSQSWLIRPVNFGVTWTRYGKIFGYMPYFGIQAGLFYTQSGYNLDEGYNIQGARQAKMDLLEMDLLAHCHFDFWKLKLIINIGPYVGYRFNIQRIADVSIPPALENNFLSTDRRWDYGITGGGGFAVVLDPIEVHFQVMYKFGFGLLYDPNYYSEYYYRFATTSDLLLSVGIHFQLTRREGRTTHQLRKDARDLYLERKYDPATEE